jgi:asparagine synthase (glutamine-hydrolysing)
MSEPPGVPRHYAWRGSFSPKQQADLFTEDAWRMISPDSAYDQPLAYEAACRSPDPVERLLYLDAKLYMQDDVLAKVDRASMAVGLEVRSPFLDPQVVEFFAQLPLRYKLRGLTTKYVLKRAVRELVPSEIIRRRKQGFAIPVADWLRRDLRPLLEDHLSAERLRCAGIFRPESVRRLLDDHFACRRDNQKYLWPLLVFELWREQYGRTAPKEAL